MAQSEAATNDSCDSKRNEGTSVTTSDRSLPGTFCISQNGLMFEQSKDNGYITISQVGNSWLSFGLDCPITPNVKTKFTIEIVKPRASDNICHLAFGFATKNVIHSIGMF